MGGCDHIPQNLISFRFNFWERETTNSCLEVSTRALSSFVFFYRLSTITGLDWTGLDWTGLKNLMNDFHVP